jgi:pimeloyl-ACP methyl ester carboxylesterase
VKTAHTPVLDIAYVENGPADGRPVVLMHGFPDDIHAYDRVVPPLTASGYRVIVPYLRGYGPTRFLDPATLRSGQQAALGHDLLDLIDVLDLKSPILAGYDWGGRAACIVAALWPERGRAPTVLLPVSAQAAPRSAVGSVSRGPAATCWSSNRGTS